MANTPVDSRFRWTPMDEHNGYTTIGMWPGFDWVDSPEALVIVASANQAGRLDDIANQYLGSPGLWWAIMYYNNKTDINWPRAGDEVKIPRLNYIKSEI